MFKTIKKIIKGIILIPMFPLIWKQVGFSLNEYCDSGTCGSCNPNANRYPLIDKLTNTHSCCERAKLLVAWFRR